MTTPAARWGVTTLSYCAVIFWLSSAPRVLPPSLEFDGADKLIHAVEYAILAALAWNTWFHAAWPGRSGWGPWLFAAMYGVSDEVHQAFVPGRTSSGWDALADAVGSALMVLVMARRLARTRG